MYEINRAAVIGAGTMGLGIAGQLADAGVDVFLLDVPADGDNRNANCERALERLLNKNQPGLLHEDHVKRINIGNVEDADRWISSNPFGNPASGVNPYNGSARMTILPKKKIR